MNSKKIECRLEIDCHPWQLTRLKKRMEALIKNGFSDIVELMNDQDWTGSLNNPPKTGEVYISVDFLVEGKEEFDNFVDQVVDTIEGIGTLMFAGGRGPFHTAPWGDILSLMDYQDGESLIITNEGRTILVLTKRENRGFELSLGPDAGENPGNFSAFVASKDRKLPVHITSHLNEIIF